MNNPPIPLSSLQELSDALDQDWQSPDCMLRKSIKGQLYRYGLTTYDASEILNESVSRAIRHLEVKGRIPDLLGWLRNASHKIIQEEYRKKKYRKKAVKKLSNKDELVARTDIESFSDEDEDKKMNLVHKLLNGLDPLEKSIIEWKSQGLSWKNICKKLADEDLITFEELNDQKTLERIKRRGNRALQKMKSLIQEANKVYK